MSVVDPEKMRSSISEVNGQIRISIPSRKNIFFIVFLLAWLAGWSIGEFTVPTHFFNEKMPPGAIAFVIAWFVLWTVAGCAAIYAWSWMIFGKEIITIDPTHVSVKKDVFGLGPNRQYLMTHVKNLRVSLQPLNMFDNRSMFQFWGLGGGSLAFDYGAKTCRFGNSIDEAEANQILKSVISKYPELFKQ